MSQPILKTVAYHEAVIQALELQEKLETEINGPETERGLNLTSAIDIQLQRIEEIREANRLSAFNNADAAERWARGE